MTDPRTELYNVLSRRLTEEMVARHEAWADYWQRRRVVVVPDGHGAQMSQSMQDTPEYLALSKARNEELNRKIDAIFMHNPPKWEPISRPRARKTRRTATSRPSSPSS